MYILHAIRYGIMKSCWNFMSEERPCFTILVKKINQQIQLSKCQQPVDAELQGNVNDPYTQTS